MVASRSNAETLIARDFKGTRKHQNRFFIPSSYPLDLSSTWTLLAHNLRGNKRKRERGLLFLKHFATNSRMRMHLCHLAALDTQRTNRLPIGRVDKSIGNERLPYRR